jgi:hypothetical protein
MVKELAHNMMNVLMELRMRVQSMQLCKQAACDTAFLMETVQFGRRIGAPPRSTGPPSSHGDRRHSSGGYHGAAAAQLQIGAVVNVWVAEQGFSLGLKDDDIADLVESSSRPPMSS